MMAGTVVGKHTAKASRTDVCTREASQLACPRCFSACILGERYGDALKVKMAAVQSVQQKSLHIDKDAKASGGASQPVNSNRSCSIVIVVRVSVGFYYGQPGVESPIRKRRVLGYTSPCVKDSRGG